jgi:glucose dehydrogenase
MCRVRDCFILITLVGLAFGLATKAVSQGSTQKSHDEWPQFNGGYDATRFSPLTQINTNNVGSLRQVARFKLPETTSFQADPVVVVGTLYVTTLHNTYAIDARTGQQRWVRHHDIINPGPARLGRGVAYPMVACSGAWLTGTCWR